MSEKVWFFDSKFGTLFRSDIAEIQRMQNRLNQQLCGRSVSLHEYADILNEQLPEDKRINMYVDAWGHYSAFKEGDKIDLIIIQTKKNEDGPILITFDVM